MCAFLGPNGAGKSTAINLIMGFLFADSGQIQVLGYLPGDVRAKRQIGFLPENFAFYPYLNAMQLLRLHLALAGVESKSSDAIASLLRQVGLDGLGRLRVGQYSRGMVQRVGIAQALAADPKLLILDEPASGLDPGGRDAVMQILTASKSNGRTVLLSSHILPDVEAVADVVVVLDHGRVVAAGKLTELLASGTCYAIVATPMPSPGICAALATLGVTLAPSGTGVRLLVEPAQQRPAIELLWSAGCEVESVEPIRASLDSFFRSLTGDSAVPPPAVPA